MYTCLGTRLNTTCGSPGKPAKAPAARNDLCNDTQHNAWCITATRPRFHSQHIIDCVYAAMYVNAGDHANSFCRGPGRTNGAIATVVWLQFSPMKCTLVYGVHRTTVLHCASFNMGSRIDEAANCDPQSPKCVVIAVERSRALGNLRLASVASTCEGDFVVRGHRCRMNGSQHGIARERVFLGPNSLVQVHLVWPEIKDSKLTFFLYFGKCGGIYGITHAWGRMFATEALSEAHVACNGSHGSHYEAPRTCFQCASIISEAGSKKRTSVAVTMHGKKYSA